jgi:hypothetical protein
MSIPPEVLFHRFFQSTLVSPTDRHNYKGKQDIEILEPALGTLLAAIQKALNEALLNEKKNVAEHVDHAPFHLDYVESSIPNALAFYYEGYSFIAITTALVRMLWDTCVRLSNSGRMATLFGITSEESDRVHALLFPTQLTFVVSHEFTHHVHGHLLPKNSDSIFPEEIVESGGIGDLETQALEIDADGYAVYHVLAHLIDGERRSQAVELLGYQNEHKGEQDRALLSSFVIAVGAFLHALRPVALDKDTIYKLRHPPQAARMNSIMQFAVSWCKQNRPELAVWMTNDKFQMLMSTAAEEFLATNSAIDWGAQITFLRSADGFEYIRKLDHCVKAHISRL